MARRYEYNPLLNAYFAKAAPELAALTKEDSPLAAESEPTRRQPRRNRRPDLSRSYEKFQRAAVVGRTGGHVAPREVSKPPAKPGVAQPNPVVGEAAPKETPMNQSFDKQGYRRGPAKRAKVHDGHAEMDVPPHSSTSGGRVRHKVGHGEAGLPADLVSKSSFQKSPRIPEDARRNQDGSRMTEEELKLYELAHRMEHDDKSHEELLDHYEGAPGGEGDVRYEFPDKRYVEMARQKQDERKARVQQTNKEEEERKMRKREKREMKRRRQEQQEGGEDQFQQSYADDADGVIITKAIANTDMIADMMRKSFGYTAEQVRDGLATIQPTVASPGAWHVGNEFEAHLDPVGGLILTRLGAGINPDNSMHLESSAADLVKQQLEHASSMAKSFADRDERNGVRLGDPNYHYRHMIDSVIKASLGKELAAKKADIRAKAQERERRQKIETSKEGSDAPPRLRGIRRDKQPSEVALSMKSLIDIYKSGDPEDEHCSKCKAKIKPGAKECHKCGTAVRQKKINKSFAYRNNDEVLEKGVFDRVKQFAGDVKRKWNGQASSSDPLHTMNDNALARLHAHLGGLDEKSGNQVLANLRKEGMGNLGSARDMRDRIRKVLRERNSLNLSITDGGQRTADIKRHEADNGAMHLPEIQGRGSNVNWRGGRDNDPHQHDLNSSGFALLSHVGESMQNQLHDAQVKGSSHGAYHAANIGAILRTHMPHQGDSGKINYASKDWEHNSADGGDAIRSVADKYARDKGWLRPGQKKTSWFPDRSGTSNYAQGFNPDIHYNPEQSRELNDVMRTARVRQDRARRSYMNRHFGDATTTKTGLFYGDRYRSSWGRSGDISGKVDESGRLRGQGTKGKVFDRARYGSDAQIDGQAYANPRKPARGSTYTIDASSPEQPPRPLTNPSVRERLDTRF